MARLAREVERREAKAWILELAKRASALPDEMKPSLEEIDQAVQEARAKIQAAKLQVLST